MLLVNHQLQRMSVSMTSLFVPASLKLGMKEQPHSETLIRNIFFHDVRYFGWTTRLGYRLTRVSVKTTEDSFGSVAFTYSKIVQCKVLFFSDLMLEIPGACKKVFDVRDHLRMTTHICD